MARTYAMEMSFDDVNTYFDGPSGTANLDTYIVKWNGTAWQNAALTATPALAQTGVADTLTGSLASEYASHSAITKYQRDQFWPPWPEVGASTLPSAPGGVGTSWAIVNNGGGDFAVVPEPSTFALLGAGLAGLIAYRVRRKARRSR